MKRALVVIDVQESFRQRPDWELASDPDVADKVAVLVDAARARDELVIWVLHTEPGSGTVFDPESGHVRLMAGLVPADDEPVLRKTAHNAFTTTNLQQLLTVAGIGSLAVCGIRTEQCCETTARLASDLGYAVEFVIDGTATTPTPHRDAPDDLSDPRTLRVEDIIARTEYALAGRFATITTVAEFAGAPVAGVR
ncbi:isochorismatase family protein [Amycolatopsis sp. CA-230715]|uniref:isochorismatase family protein n=1 Tax=Amycolatopsis sp. CA-230715 TaxID=2745196 RepID=UPI001C037CDE|nr:isochorismatase family protein [Amycolatopsis sp. CA-230715]QWF81811.1 hypothetical protein HUW46_05244 [Amycolatopsis sp. CA-230715]